eukprot:10104808-Alexandrium_andersonii.AAC.1
MSASLVGSEMCIRDRCYGVPAISAVREGQNGLIVGPSQVPSRAQTVGSTRPALTPAGDGQRRRARAQSPAPCCRPHESSSP